MCAYSLKLFKFALVYKLACVFNDALITIIYHDIFTL